MSNTRELSIPDGLAGMRLDQALARLFGLSRTAAAALIEEGRVQVNGEHPDKATLVHEGAQLSVDLPPPPAPLTSMPPQAVEGLEVLYADNAIVVVNKPIGVAAHASVGWSGPTVLSGLAAMGHTTATGGAAERQGIVHRLDVGTSGVMVVAKSEEAYSVLKQAFRDRTIAKVYHALVQGHPDPSRGTIDAPIDRHRRHDYKFTVMANGKPSITHYETLEAFRAVSLMSVKLETGRTHQIRVHFAAIGHPCAGDLTYGADPTLADKLHLTRQWLHATSLGFEHPTRKTWVEFEAPYPHDLADALNIVRQWG